MSDVFNVEVNSLDNIGNSESAPSTSLEDQTAADETNSQIEIVQNVEDESGEVSTTTLDIGQLNEFVASENELRAMQIVNPSTNDYFDFMPETIENYFAGIMDKYPTKDYYSYHLRHWVSNGQYYSYYDDYYYLFPDLNSNECFEVIKYNGQSNYVVNHTTGTPASATIEYGSAVGQSDFRKGVSTLETKVLLFVAALLCIYVVLHNLFAHFAHH